MGKYIDSTALEERIGATRLAGLCGSTGDTQATLLLGVVSRAEALIESYAATRYAMPLQTCPMVVEWCLRIAEYELYKRTPGDAVPQKIKDSYSEVVGQLEAMSAGTLKLVSDTPQTPANAAGSSLTVAGRSFDNSSYVGF